MLIIVSIESEVPSSLQSPHSQFLHMADRRVDLNLRIALYVRQPKDMPDVNSFVFTFLQIA